MNEVKRKLASVQIIKDLTPIKGADRIECAQILGWKVVVRKGEFSVGNKCVYFEIDSLLPDNILKKVGLWNEAAEMGKLSGPKGNRLRTVRMRSQFSQGLAVPLSSVTSPCFETFKEGDDLTELLGIEKYEEEVPDEIKAIAKSMFPVCLRKTDSYRIQAYPDLIQEMQGVPCYATLKIDGESSTFYHKRDEHLPHELGVCSRRVEFKQDTPVPHWDMVEKYELELLRTVGNVALQAEMHGPGINKNRLEIDQVSLAAFDIFDIDNYEFFNYEDLKSVLSSLSIPMVPRAYIGPFNWSSVDSLVEFASAQKYPNGGLAEGIVIRPLEEKYSEVLSGRMAFKVISPKYLEKHGE